MKKEGKIYVLKDPITNEVRYIGQTKHSLKSRMNTHIYDSIKYRYNAPKCNWVRKLLNNNLFPIIEVIEEVENDKLDEREIYWISYYRNILGKKILNLTDGGNNICVTIKIYQKKKQNKKIYVINRFTLEQKIFYSTQEVATYLKCKRSNIPKAIHIKGECKEHFISYKRFPKKWKPPINKSFLSVELTDTSGNIFVFKSRSHAIRFTNGTHSQHKNGAISALNNNHLYRGYYWKYIKAPLVNKTVKKSGEFRETPAVDNPEPSSLNSIKVNEKVQRLIGEELTNKPNTSAGHPGINLKPFTLVLEENWMMR